MKKELTDLIPVYGMFHANKRMDKEADEDTCSVLIGDISLSDAKRKIGGRLAYFAGLAVWNVGISYIAPRAIYGASELIDKLN